MLKRVIAALLTVPLTVPPLAGPAVAAGARGDTVMARLRQAVKNLPVAVETRAGYDRDKFHHWVDASGDCRDTRDEVLAAESLSNVRGCDIQTGRWRSYYDGVVTRDSTSFDIDHLVALAEAWDSGARRWTADTRQRFANDLADPRSLVAVSASSTRSVQVPDPVGRGEGPLALDRRHGREALADPEGRRLLERGHQRPQGDGQDHRAR